MLDKKTYYVGLINKRAAGEIVELLFQRNVMSDLTEMWSLILQKCEVWSYRNVKSDLELIPMLRTQMFIVMGLVDAVPMIAVGISMYILFAVAG